MMKNFLIPGAVLLLLTLAGCGSTPSNPATSATTAKGGGYYLDDGPGANPPSNLDEIPDAVPRNEPLHRFANRTYAALGNTYTPMSERIPFSEEGVASWYGRRFHGKKTASGKPYDMYAMTAAHPTLPIPSYARVTALDNGKSVVVRINDRGPFHSSRVIDLSYAAAYKLGYVQRGSTRVRVEAITPDVYEVPAVADGGGVFLQLGAFSSAGNAQTFLDRLARESGLDERRTHVVLIGSLYRVQVGPYASEDAAASERERMRERLDLNPVLVRRD